MIGTRQRLYLFKHNEEEEEEEVLLSDEETCVIFDISANEMKPFEIMNTEYNIKRIVSFKLAL